MASRILLSRSKTLTLISRSQASRRLHSLLGSQQSDSTSPAISSSILGSTKNSGYEKNLPRWLSGKAYGEPISKVYDSAVKKARGINSGGVVEPDARSNAKEVLCFSPLEAAASTRTHGGGLAKESLKVKRIELSQKITFALIPALILLSKSSVTTSLLIFSVYWQVYGYFKEIFLDYVHHEVTREWVLVYFKVLLLILAKDTMVHFGLV